LPHTTGAAVTRVGILAISCAVSSWLITHILAGAYSVSRGDDLLGGMWAVVATIFVCRYSHAESVRAALSRKAALIGIGAILVTLMKRPDDTITTGITTTVTMVVAELAPEYAWRQPILRLVDTAVGVAEAWIGNQVIRASTVLEQGSLVAGDAE